MKKHITFILVISIFTCSATKEVGDVKPYTDFKIVNVPIIVENDTVLLNELRFYKIQSAMDGMKLMYQNYGQWNKKINGMHQQNINKIVWENIKLIEGDNKTFTVVADGTETTSNYFACLMIFDSDENDCLMAEHPYKEKLIKLFVDKMGKIDKNSSIYRLFRKKM